MCFFLYNTGTRPTKYIVITNRLLFFSDQSIHRLIDKWSIERLIQNETFIVHTHTHTLQQVEIFFPYIFKRSHILYTKKNHWIIKSNHELNWFFFLFFSWFWSTYIKSFEFDDGDVHTHTQTKKKKDYL